MNARDMALRLKAHPRLYQGARATWSRVNRVIPPRRFDGVPGRIHRSDTMIYASDPKSVHDYATSGRVTLDLLDRVITGAGRKWSDIDAFLDFGSGFGRVTRYLVSVLPASSITACDIDADAVHFCSREFGVMSALGTPDMARGSLSTYDLIWAGSVATHLPRDAWHAWLRLMSIVARPDALVVFTTHGPSNLDDLGRYDPTGPGRRPEVQAQLDHDGFAYFDYRHSGPGYGVAFHTPERVRADADATGLELVVNETRGWENHQDVNVARPRGAG